MSGRKPRVQVALDGTRYTGSLAQPIIVPFELYLADALRNYGTATGEPSAVDSFIAKERGAKVPELLQLYGVRDGQGLAARLAVAHIPGFQLGRRRGAPKKEITGQHIVQLLDGWRAQNPGKSLASAIKWAIKTGPLSGMKVEAVRRRYNLARARKK
jgi:hypothetical protein